MIVEGEETKPIEDGTQSSTYKIKHYRLSQLTEKL